MGHSTEARITFPQFKSTILASPEKLQYVEIYLHEFIFGKICLTLKFSIGNNPHPRHIVKPILFPDVKTVRLYFFFP